MKTIDERASRTLEQAESIHALLKEHGLDSALIGAMACAVHGYSRATEDVDLAVYADPFLQLPAVVRALSDRGLAADFSRPDADDPLGGVITVTGADHDPIQIVNFCNPLSGQDNPGWEALQGAQELQGRALRVVSLAHLIALKLYAGGAKSRLDVIELLERNATVELDWVRVCCRKFGLGDSLESLLVEIGLE